MPEKFNLELDDLQVDGLELPTGDGASLETMTTGQGLTEMGASDCGCWCCSCC
ncbi:thiomuracin/GE37468 family thiazolyl RiPP peptide [Halostreptopolyspora alba]|uniref:GE37468 family thiazolyl peptide n=1 Tax=Halostreptopolyspora alba TaxID=2487137 RepID=A0A3N0E8M9_9ACTN|nr:GE37468 family thiazolyl peptide [Nocardiopsaceae bacterium YIM 96095]